MTVTFPSAYQWLPNPDYLGDVGATLLSVCQAALEKYSRNAENYRAILAQSTAGLAWRRENKDSSYTLLVSLDSVQCGKAGQKDYTFADGLQGKMGYVVAQYTVSLANPQATPRGGMAPALPPEAALLAQSLALWRDGWAVWAAVRSLALGGVKTTPPILPTPRDQILPGPLTPKESGGMISLEFGVEVQL